MLIAALLTVTALSTTETISAEDSICKLNLQTQLVPHDEPLILKEDNEQQFDIVWPEVEENDGLTQGVINVPADKKLLIACTGPKNTISTSKKQSAYAECSGGVLKIDDEIADEDTLSCTSGAAKSGLRKTTDKCGKGYNVGNKLELGFWLTDEKSGTFLSMVDVCHNIEQMVSYYAAHSLYGKSLKGAVKSSQRRSFSTGPKELGLFRDVAPENLYSQEEQKKTLDIILGEGAGELYVNKTVYLARGHLAPDADFIYHSGQLMTYYYINVAPQWQTFNAGNWLRIESAVRDLAIMEGETLFVLTGTYGILKLKDLKGNEQEIYLDPSRKLIPVPEVYWKLVQHPVKKLCTVAVGHNNVFLEVRPAHICKTVSAFGWPEEVTKLYQGYVYYCDYESFKETVGYVPHVECEGIFEFSHLKKTQKVKREKAEKPKKDKPEKSNKEKPEKPKQEKTKNTKQEKSEKQKLEKPKEPRKGKIKEEEEE